MKHTYAIKIENNKIIDDLIIPVHDGEYQIQISKPKRLRSGNQLRYLMGVVYKMIVDDSGNDLLDIHKAFAEMFLKDVVVIKGVEYIITKSLSDLGGVDTGEMHDYIERVRAYAAIEYGIAIPDPV